MQERQVAEQRQRPAAVRPADGRPDGGGDGSVDAGEPAVADDHAARPDVVRRGHQVEVADRVGRPDEQQSPLGHGGADRPGDVVRCQHPLLGQQQVEPARDIGVAGAPLLLPGVGLARRLHGDRLQGQPVDHEVHVVARVAPPGRTAHGVELDVVARQQPAHRTRQRRVPEHHHLLDAPGEVLVGQQQPVAADHALAGAGTTGRLGQQRPAGLLGEPARGRTGVVTGDHHGPQVAADRGRLRLRRVARRHPGVAVRRAVEVAAPSVADPRHDRLLELQVEVHGPGSVGPEPALRGAGGTGGECAPGDDLPPLHLAAAGLGRGDVGLHADRATEQPRLLGGLVGVGAAEPGRPVGGEEHERHAGVRRLEDGRVQVRDRRAAGRDDDDRAVAGAGDAEGQEAGRPLVDARVQHQPLLRGRRERQSSAA